MEIEVVLGSWDLASGRLTFAAQALNPEQVRELARARRDGARFVVRVEQPAKA